MAAPAHCPTTQVPRTSFNTGPTAPANIRLIRRVARRGGGCYLYDVLEPVRQHLALRRQIAMDFSEDTLDYGYVADRLPDRSWWHIHFGRSAWWYECALLGRRTNVMASLQWLAPFAKVISSPFILTLDGEGVGMNRAKLKLDFHWNVDSQVRAEGIEFQQRVMPLLYDSPEFQKAVARIMARLTHLRRIAPGRLSRIDRRR